MTVLYDLPGHLIRRLHQISLSAFATETSAAGFDLTPVQYAALTALETAPGVDQATLAGLIAYDRVTIGGVISRLEDRGYLERTTSSNDRRSKELRITAAGIDLLKAIEASVLRAQEIMLGPLRTDERAQFMQCLKKLVVEGNELSRSPHRPADPLAARSQEQGLNSLSKNERVLFMQLLKKVMKDEASEDESKQHSLES